MKQASLDWGKLNEITSTWFTETRRKLRRHRPDTSHSDERFCVLAQYCLIACEEYRDAAFDAFAQDRFHAGLNSLRPILEHAIHLWWCGAERQKVRERLDMWQKETARQRKNREEAWRDLKPRGSPAWVQRDKRADCWRRELDKRCKVGKLPSIQELVQALKNTPGLPPELASVYPLYRDLCRSSHAPLYLDEVFETRVGARVTRSRREMPWMAPMESVYIPLVLVSAVDVYFQWKRTLLGDGFQQAKQILDLHYKRAAQDAARRAEKAP